MISFARKYPVDVKTSTGRTLPAFLELGLTGPVDPKSGMIVNLVEIDKDARALIAQFESSKFESAEATLDWIRDAWILRAERRELRAGVIGIRGRFGQGRFRFTDDGQRRTEWKLRAFAVNPSTGLGGQLFAVGSTRKHAFRQLQELKEQKSFSLESFAALKLPYEIFEIGFRERKSERQISVRL